MTRIKTNRDVDEQFDDLGEELLAAAARIDCSPGVYRVNLGSIKQNIQTAIDASYETDPEDDGE